MDKPDLDTRDPLLASDPPREDDFEGLAAFYERTGAMAVNTIGPPIDRPIIPPRRPDRVGDFDFTPHGITRPATPSRLLATDEPPEAQEIREEFLELLDKQLRRP